MDLHQLQQAGTSTPDRGRRIAELIIVAIFLTLAGSVGWWFFWQEDPLRTALQKDFLRPPPGSTLLAEARSSRRSTGMGIEPSGDTFATVKKLFASPQSIDELTVFYGPLLRSTFREVLQRESPPRESRPELGSSRQFYASTPPEDSAEVDLSPHAPSPTEDVQTIRAAPAGTRTYVWIDYTRTR